jgi:hypothetical protein
LLHCFLRCYRNFDPSRGRERMRMSVAERSGCSYAGEGRPPKIDCGVLVFLLPCQKQSSGFGNGPSRSMRHWPPCVPCPNVRPPCRVHPKFSNLTPPLPTYPSLWWHPSRFTTPPPTAGFWPPPPTFFYVRR